MFYILLILASAYFSLHHVILDGIVWFVRWRIVEEQPAFLWPPTPSENVQWPDRYQHPVGRYNVNGGYVVSKHSSQKNYESLDQI